MKTLFIAIPTPKHTPDAKEVSTRILGLSEKMETLPTVYEACEVYAVRCSESTIEEARTLLSKEHTAGKALGLLRRQAHSFSFVGNV